MVTTHITQLPVNAISVIDDEVRIDLTVRDGVLADFLTSRQEAGWADEIANVLAVGVRGLTTMGAGATVKGVGEEIERLLQSVTSTTEARVKEIIDTSGAALAGSLDPAIRSSVTARALGEIEAAHRDVLSRLDPDRADSHTARLIADLSAMLGPEGLLQERLAETFDPGADESAMSRLVSTIDLRFREMRELIVGTSKRNEEAARGTAKGLEYEGDVVVDLRTMAAEIGGCTVEATGRVTGALDPLAKVGDAVLTLPDATRVAIEAKNVANITLTGKDGILDELDRAMANRAADWGVCVSKRDAYPNEVGALGIYGKRILIVDDGDGVLLRVALRWIRACSEAGARQVDVADVEKIHDSVERLRRLAQRFTGAKRALTGVRTSIDQVRGELDGLRTDLLDLVEELGTAMRTGTAADR